MKRSLDSMTVGEIGGLLDLQGKVDKVALVMRKRSKLASKIEKLDERIKKLLGLSSGRGRPPKAKRAKRKYTRRKKTARKPRAKKAQNPQHEPKVIPS